MSTATAATALGVDSGPARGIDQLLLRARARLRRLDPAEAMAAIRAGAILVDTRPESWRRAEGEIPGALVVERTDLEWRLDPASSGAIPEAVDSGIRWIVFCNEGYASSLAAASLQVIGLWRATDLAGGYRAWRAAGLPVTAPGQPSPPRFAPLSHELAGSPGAGSPAASRR